MLEDGAAETALTRPLKCRADSVADRGAVAMQIRHSARQQDVGVRGLGGSVEGRGTRRAWAVRVLGVTVRRWTGRDGNRRDRTSSRFLPGTTRGTIRWAVGTPPTGRRVRDGVAPGEVGGELVEGDPADILVLD
ncbi:hypothetical protein Nans01_20320 [Nocardiopsis ansamitocini]|uniref:Uncharacterized protein n=1 Tax=Nocardiopsis ansamitocini TaxID=1670832 RepID=A0A9W6P5T5_9ACTN|nr:hypothetical protein Nans01_20320 [Nocardiopsis ansamitocini]